MGRALGVEEGQGGGSVGLGSSKRVVGAMECWSCGGGAVTSDSLPLPAGPAPPLFPGRKSHPVPGGAGLRWKERLAG